MLTSADLMPVGSWQDDAACRDVDPNLFFDETHRGEALALCSRCPVRQPCLEHALRTQELHGVWGGTDEGERRRMLRRRFAA